MMETVCLANVTRKQAGAALLVPEKIDIKLKGFKRYK